MIKLRKIKIIKNEKGNLIKFINKNNLKIKFGEIYFSEVLPNKFKGWKFHENRNQLMTIASGKVRFSFKSKNTNKLKIKTLSFPKRLSTIFIPKKAYYSFKCLSNKKALLVNIIDEIV